MNYQEILRKQHELKDQIRKLDFAINRGPYNHIVVYVLERAEIFETDDELATKIAEQLEQRDEPATSEEIRAVFEFSGLEYSQKHIDLACPNDPVKTEEFRAEERRNLE